jgi:hypothetical protein
MYIPNRLRALQERLEFRLAGLTRATAVLRRNADTATAQAPGWLDTLDYGGRRIASEIRSSA